MIGPAMINYRKTFHTYLFFASTLISLRRDLEALRAFGTDGEIEHCPMRFHMSSGMQFI